MGIGYVWASSSHPLQSPFCCHCVLIKIHILVTEVFCFEFGERDRTHVIDAYVLLQVIYIPHFSRITNLLR